MRVALAKSFARIHWQNLVNFGVLPLTFARKKDYDALRRDMKLKFTGLHKVLKSGDGVDAEVDGHGDDADEQRRIAFEHRLSSRQVETLLSGGIINWECART